MGTQFPHGVEVCTDEKTIEVESSYEQTESDAWITDTECSVSEDCTRFSGGEVRAVEEIAARDMTAGRQDELSIDAFAKEQ